MNGETMQIIGETISAILILMGAILSALSAFGLVRLPDVYLRAHAAGKSATLGVLSVLTGVFLYFAFFLDYVSAKLLLGIVFVFLTAPVAAHLTGRSAYRSGVSLWQGSVKDELRPALEKLRVDEAKQAEGK